MCDHPPNRLVVGVMTGTSIDGFDAALVKITGEGPGMRAEMVAFRSEQLGELQPDLRRAAEQVPMAACDFASLAWRFGELHAAVIERLLDGRPRPDLIVAHGQTVYHRPPVSWQLLNPAPIAARVGCRVICDLRQPDLARGGQGAPITPLADWILFRDPRKTRAIVNLGGYANATILPRDDGTSSIDGIRAFDICACNHVLDAVAQRAFGEPFDRNGDHAAHGTADAGVANAMFESAGDGAAHRRSLGTGDEDHAWVDRHTTALLPPDLAATAVLGIAQHIARTLTKANPAIDEILLAGGGAHNRTLVQRIAEQTTANVLLTDELGIPMQAREAMAMAILGALTTDGVSITLPQVTGRN